MLLSDENRITEKEVLVLKKKALIPFLGILVSGHIGWGCCLIFKQSGYWRNRIQ